MQLYCPPDQKGGSRTIEYTQLYLSGEWLTPAHARRRQLINPATEEIYAVISMGDARDVDAAVVAAKAIPGDPNVETTYIGSVVNTPAFRI